MIGFILLMVMSFFLNQHIPHDNPDKWIPLAIFYISCFGAMFCWNKVLIKIDKLENRIKKLEEVNKNDNIS